jgi:3beta-hydroxy-Delta5-steroid dehydrogenase / steroid Delta-isomerase
MLTCAIRPSGIWGRGDQSKFRKLFESVVAGQVKVLSGRKSAKLDNSHVHTLVHGFIMAVQHLVPGGTAPGQAYFINDGEPVNMFEFAQPIIKACGQRWPRLRVSGAVVRFLMVTWQRLHFRLGLPRPPLEPLAVERVYLDNYFSIAEAERDLGYRPLFTTEQAVNGPHRRRKTHGSEGSGQISPVALLTSAARSSRARSGNTSSTAPTTVGN